MRILFAFLLLFVTTVTASSQAIWRNFFTINANPIVDVVAGSNATVQASTPAVNIRRFTVNGVTDTNAVGLLITNVISIITLTNVYGSNVIGTVSSATNATYVTTAVLTNQTYASNVISGGILTIDAMATNSPWDNAFLKGGTGTRFWSQDGMGLTNLQGSNIVGTITVDTLNVGDLVVTNPPYLNLSNSTNYGGTVTGLVLPAVKAAFSTNYTVASTDAVLFCSGTNQLITLSDCTNTATPVGRMFTIIAASGTASVIVTNANGVQKLLNALSISVSATNRLTVISDGSNWW